MGNKGKVVAITHYCSLSDLAISLSLGKKMQTQVPKLWSYALVVIPHTLPLLIPLPSGIP